MSEKSPADLDQISPREPCPEEIVCPQCEGTGRDDLEICSRCEGSGVVIEGIGGG